MLISDSAPPFDTNTSPLPPQNGAPPLLKVPSAYAESYPAARAQTGDWMRADNYVAHTMIGDPLADAAVDDLDPLGPEETNRLLREAFQGNDEALRKGPESLRELFESAKPPDWLDMSTFMPACRLFHRAGTIVLAAMVGGTLVEGFATNIAKSFFMTGRLRDQGIRRLKQNNRHMLEIFMPGGLETYGDGWAYSIRIRIVHARIRRLLEASDDWDEEELGIPISAAHLGFAISIFGARTLQYMEKLGGTVTDEERKSFMAVWRYSGYLMGIPETILYTDEADALALARIGLACEPPVSLESRIMAASLINSAPLFIGHMEGDQRRKTASYGFDICRALLGPELADGLQIPDHNTRGVLWKFRWTNRLLKLGSKLSRTRAAENANIMTFFEVSMYEKDGISYRLPDHHFAERSSSY